MQKIKLTEQDIDNQYVGIKEQLMNLGTYIGHHKIDTTWNLKITEEMPKAVISMTSKAYDKMMSLILMADKEIGWHGTVTQQDALHYTITDILVFPQEVTGASVRPPAEEYIKWLTEFPRETRTAIKFHGHSHVNMGVSPSATDTKYQEDIVKQMESGIYIFFIVNKKNEFFVRLYDIDNNLVYDTADVELQTDFTSSRLGWAANEIKGKVKEEVRTTYTYANQNNTQYGQKNTALTAWERERMNRVASQVPTTKDTTPSTPGKSGKGYGKPGRPTKAEEAARKAQLEKEEQEAQVDKMMRDYHRATPGSAYDEHLRATHPELYGGSATKQQEVEY